MDFVTYLRVYPALIKLQFYIPGYKTTDSGHDSLRDERAIYSCFGTCNITERSSLLGLRI